MLTKLNGISSMDLVKFGVDQTQGPYRATSDKKKPAVTKFDSILNNTGFRPNNFEEFVDRIKSVSGLLILAI